MRKAMQQAGNAHADSYAENSSLQNHSFRSFAKGPLGDAIQLLVSTTWRPASAAEFHCGDDDSQAGSSTAAPAQLHISIADFGCSFGPNTLDCMRFVVSTLLHCCSADEERQLTDTEIHYFFCDLPSNDFNALFRSLSTIADKRDLLPPNVFTAGVSGSFHGRLLPTASLQLAISSYSLHWLTQIPPSLTDRTSPAWNGGSTWMHRDTLPAGALDACAAQSQSDLKVFLNSRAQELVSGGILFLFSATTSSRNGWDASDEIFDMAWKELVAEGIITMEEMDLFNLPIYMFNQEELEGALKDILEYRVLHMETVREMPMFWGIGDQRHMQVQQWLGMVSSVMKPTVEDYLGQMKSEQLFKRLKIVAWRELDRFSTRIIHDLVITTLLRL